MWFKTWVGIPRFVLRNHPLPTFRGKGPSMSPENSSESNSEASLMKSSSPSATELEQLPPSDAEPSVSESVDGASCPIRCEDSLAQVLHRGLRGRIRNQALGNLAPNHTLTIQRRQSIIAAVLGNRTVHKLQPAAPLRRTLFCNYLQLKAPRQATNLHAAQGIQMDLAGLDGSANTKATTKLRKRTSGSDVDIGDMLRKIKENTLEKC